MGFLKYILVGAFLVVRCGKTQEISNDMDLGDAISQEGIDYRESMRSFVIDLSRYAKARNPKFAIIPQNGIELITQKQEAQGAVFTEYLDAIDATGQEELFYGYKEDDKETNVKVTSYLLNYLKIFQKYGNDVFVIDYCSTNEKILRSIDKNRQQGFISFQATDRDLSVIPQLKQTITPANNVDLLSDAKNFLFFLNYENYGFKQEVIDAIAASDYDIVFMDMFFNDGLPFSKSMIQSLKTKPKGGKRLVVSYMSIGEAENYRFYWKNAWNREPPVWLDKENPNWPGNFKVKYWHPQWQEIIFGSEDAYLDSILGLDFDGVYLDIIDAFQYYE